MPQKWNTPHNSIAEVAVVYGNFHTLVLIHLYDNF